LAEAFLGTADFPSTAVLDAGEEHTLCSTGGWVLGIVVTVDYECRLLLASAVVEAVEKLVDGRILLELVVTAVGMALCRIASSAVAEFL
jgi:hypothetical protein